MAAKNADRSSRVSRRSPAEVNRIILWTARQLFNAHGYHGTTTRQIAEQAEVGESVVFRHFGSKAELFETSILTPFIEFVTEWARTWNRRPPAATDPVAITRSFVRGFFTFAEDHRELLQTLLAAQVQGGDPALAATAARFSEHFADGLLLLRGVLLEQSAARRYEHLDAPVTVAIASGAVLSLVLMDSWLFAPGARRPGRDRQIEELTRMLMFGISGRPPRP